MESEKSCFVNEMSEIWRKMQVNFMIVYKILDARFCCFSVECKVHITLTVVKNLGTTHI